MRTVTFLTMSLIVIMAPGPDLVLITRVVLHSRGRRPAVAAAAGMVTAGALHVLVGVVGLAALLVANPTVFAAVRRGGAVVLLVWAGLHLRSALRTAGGGAEPLPDQRLERAFLQGLVCTGTNPKVGIFLMAFLPQFVPAGMPAALGVGALGAFYLVLGFLWLLAWIALVHRLGRSGPARGTRRAIDVVAAGVFATFAMHLLLGFPVAPW